MLQRLQSVGIPIDRAKEYEKLLQQHNLTDDDVFNEVTSEDLLQIGIQSLGDRKRLRVSNSPTVPTNPTLVVPSLGAPDLATEEISFHNLIGRGTYGDIYSCKLKSTGATYAVKRIYLTNANKELVDSIEREIEFLSTLKHENIVQFAGFKRTEGEIDLFMELFEPPASLKNFIDNLKEKKKKPFAPEEVQKYALQVATGLKYLHDNNIAHRDLKSDNILIHTYFGKITSLHIADFGVSKQLEGSLLAATHIGTPPYMAPEVLNAQQGFYDGLQADIWSYGMVLYEMMSLERPNASLTKQYKRNPLPTSIQGDDFFQGVVAIYEECTEIEPSKRPKAASVVEKLETASLLPSYFIKRNLLDIRELIGEGTNSKVYRGTCRCDHGNKSEPHLVAIKIFPLSDSLNTTQMLQRLSTLYKLESAHVVTPHGYNWQDKSQFMVVLPLMSTDLRTWISIQKNNRPSVGIIISLLTQIAKGASYLHSRNIFIGNLNSKNIRITDRTCCIELSVNPIPASEAGDIFQFGLIILELYCMTPPTVKKVSPTFFNRNPLPVSIPKDMPEELSKLLKECVSAIESSRPSFSRIVERLKPPASQKDWKAIHARQNVSPRARLSLVKQEVNFLKDEESKVFEFWQIWSESIPAKDKLAPGDVGIEFHVATTADMQKLTWRTAGPQNIFIQKMMDFFWQVGAPGSEFDKLNDVGASVRPVKIGSWIDMSAKGAMDGGWYFPGTPRYLIITEVDIPLKLAVEAADTGDAVKKFTDWAEIYNIGSIVAIGRDMGAAPPRQTEFRVKLPGSDTQTQIGIAAEAFATFGFPPIPDNAMQILKDSNPENGSLLNVVTSSGLMVPRPQTTTVRELCRIAGGNQDDMAAFESSVGTDAPAYVEFQFLMKPFGYGVYKEGFDIVFHYSIGEETPKQSWKKR